MNQPDSSGGTSGKIPLKVNALEFVRVSNTQLAPLFPYMGPGAIVPCCAAFESDGSGTHIGYFLHENSVDEVAVVMASNGRMRTGDVFVGPRVHGVGGDSDEPYFAVMTITQRQMEVGSQPESLSFQCEKCNTVLHHYEYDDTVSGEGKFAGLPTIIGSENWAIGYNSDESLRECPSCKHVNRPFPLYIWGWDHYSRNTRVVEKAWQSMEEAGA